MILQRFAPRRAHRQFHRRPVGRHRIHWSVHNHRPREHRHQCAPAAHAPHRVAHCHRIPPRLLRHNFHQFQHRPGRARQRIGLLMPPLIRQRFAPAGRHLQPRHRPVGHHHIRRLHRDRRPHQHRQSHRPATRAPYIIIHSHRVSTAAGQVDVGQHQGWTRAIRQSVCTIKEPLVGERLGAARRDREHDHIPDCGHHVRWLGCYKRSDQNRKFRGRTCGSAVEVAHNDTIVARLVGKQVGQAQRRAGGGQGVRFIE